MTDDDRITAMARRLLDAAASGDVDAELAAVGHGEAPAVLGALARLLLVLSSAQQLADEPETDEAAGEPLEAVANPWQEADEVTELLAEARLVFDLLTDDDDVGLLLRGARALDADDARNIVFERGLNRMVERGPKPPPDA